MVSLGWKELKAHSHMVHAASHMLKAQGHMVHAAGHMLKAQSHMVQAAGHMLPSISLAPMRLMVNMPIAVPGMVAREV